MYDWRNGVVVTEAGSYFRLIDSCVIQLKAQGLFKTCNESKGEEGKQGCGGWWRVYVVVRLEELRVQGVGFRV